VTATETRPVVRSQVEPRIVERRRTVLEAQRRRRRRWWIALAVVLALVASVIGAAWSPLLDVDDVAVSGADGLDPAELRAASGVEPGDQMVLVDLAAARDRLRALPMVAAATVTREWPDTVRLEVVEEQPILRVRSGERVSVVSSTGRVLPDGLDGADALPVLEVSVAPPEQGEELPDSLQAALVVFARLPDSLRAVLTSARIDESGVLTFSLPDDASIRFGPVEDVPAKLVAIQAFLEQVTLQCLEVLDVGQPDRPTASRIEGCAAPAPTEVDATAPQGDGTGTGDSATTTTGTVAEGGTPR
jgi:cell division protein FtsQ